jgi:hypothetical protein
VTGLQAGKIRITVGFPAKERDFFSVPNCPEQLWGIPSLPLNDTRGSFPGFKVART